ncbi:MAG: hypothetical protein IKM64_07995, partial [Clostridia bacterium]|nr:hypothetical protein [Clostridia bacterium]
RNSKTAAASPVPKAEMEDICGRRLLKPKAPSRTLPKSYTGNSARDKQTLSPRAAFEYLEQQKQPTRSGGQYL